MVRSKATTTRSVLQALEETKKRKKKAALLAALAGAFSVQALAPHIIKTPMYDSARTGEHYIQELLSGHPERFYNEIGMSKHVFRKLKTELEIYAGFSDTKHLTMEEQLGLFLSFCRSGCGSRKVREQFQRSPDTVSKYVSSSKHSIILLTML